MHCAICGVELEVGSCQAIPICFTCFNDFIPLPRKQTE